MGDRAGRAAARRAVAVSALGLGMVWNTHDPSAMPGRFRILDAATLGHMPPPTFVVDGILPAGSLGVLYGAPGSGKSFVALDLALCIATGRPWHGATVQRGAVLYIAAEGSAGLSQRLNAWRGEAGMSPDDPLDAYFVTEAVNLLRDGDVDALLADVAVSVPTPIACVFVDTLARCLVGGDENSAKDMGLAIANLDRMRTVLKAAVLPVRHSGKNAEAERGSSALRGAADTMIALANDGETITVTCAKQKDAEPFDALALRLVLTADGASCVLRHGIYEAETTIATGNRRVALAALVEYHDADGATYTAWLETAKLEKTTFRRTAGKLRKAEWVELDGAGRGARYRVTEKGRAALGGSRGHSGATPLNASEQTRGHSGAHTHRCAPDASNAPKGNGSDPAHTPDAGDRERSAIPSPCARCGDPATDFDFKTAEARCAFHV